MRHPVLRTPLPVIGITTALIIGGGVAAFAAWDVSARSATFTVTAAHIPRMGPPRVRVGKTPQIRWGAVELLPGVPAQRYVVTRTLGPLSQVACDVPPGATLQCVDEFAPAGYRATYSVAATYGLSWVGPPGAPSRAVTMPGTAVPMLINGVMVVPGVGGEPIVDGTGGPAQVAAASPAPALSSPASSVPLPPPPELPGTPDPVPTRVTEMPEPPVHSVPAPPPSDPPSQPPPTESSPSPTDAQ